MSSSPTTVQDRLSDAGELHRRDYTTRDVHAVWCLEANAILHGHLADDDGPLKDDGKRIAAFYLTSAEWREVQAAAQVIADLAGLVAMRRELGE